MAVSEAVLSLVVAMKDETSSAASSIGSSLGTLGTIAGGAALAGVAAFGAVLASGVADAREAAQVMAQTEQAVAALGSSAQISATEVADMSASLSAAAGMSLFGDDQVQAAANVALQYSELAGIIPEVTALSVDMATRLGTEPAAAAQTLARALQEPFDAQAKLEKQGIILDEQQKALLATMEEAGDVAGAQALLMTELEQTFGGSAEAAAKADGGWAQLNDQWGEAKETLGAAVLPLLNSLVGVLSDQVMPVIEAAAAMFGDLIGGLSGASEATGAVGSILAAVSPIFDDIQAAAAEVFNTLWTEGKPILDDLGKIAMPALAAAGRLIASYWENILKPALMTTWDIFKTYLLPAIGDVVHVLSIVLPPVIDLLAAVFTDVLFPAIGSIGESLKYVGDRVNEVIGFFQNLGSSLTSIEIPDWLQGHSPPPLANWFDDIAKSSQEAQAATGIDLGSSAGALPAGGGAGGAGMVTIGSVTINVTGADDPRAVALKVRDELIAVGRSNVDIFGGLA